MFLRSLLALALAATPVDAERAMLAGLQAVDARVTGIGHRLAVAGMAHCMADARPLPGFLIHTLDQYDPGLRAAARAQFGLDAAPVVLAVAPGSAAERAGLRAGDALVSVEGKPTLSEPARKASFARSAAIEALIEQGIADGRLDLLLAGGKVVSVAGDRGCPTRFQVVPGRALNASADGTYVQLSTGLVEFVRSDDELALVIAHELAHNILKHRDRLDAQGVSRGLFRAFGKNPGRIRATESEADRLALRLMHAAGYDIAVAPGFWDRFGRETDAGIFSDRTHASRKERVAAAEAEIAAIRAASD